MALLTSKTRRLRAPFSRRKEHLLWLSAIVISTALGFPLPAHTETWKNHALPFWDNAASWQEGTVPNAQGGLDFRLTEDATLGLSYNGQFASSAKQNGFNAKLSVGF